MNSFDLTDDRLPSRFWAKVQPVPNGCWLWSAAKTKNGYALLLVKAPNTSIGYSQRVAHKFAYEHLVGPVPTGMQLDHLCRIRHCVNPAHLEPVTAQVNLMRSVSPCAINAAKTHCPQGHAYDSTNTYVTPSGQRKCRTCNRDRGRALRMSRRAG